MTYQVLARKWRPQDFASLVGQEPIVQALRNALAEDRIAQAYVFSGIRGVGKTTAARVLAKALNCQTEVGSEERADVDPCNACQSCRDITEGRDLFNVREIDAATYSKVEQVRELTDLLLKNKPEKDHYMIVIMDEVHRLSRQAFDALLKIVEEPPPRLVFIFATTELDAVPATLLSRCQEFQFRRVPSPVLAMHLRTMADAESIEVSDPALRMIARAGEGSVRDSVALLDQLATFGGGTISDQDANRLLGGLDAEIFRRLLAGILGGEHAAVTGVVAEVEENGWDPQHVYAQFLGYVRDALHLALGGKPEAIDLPLEEAKALAELVGGAGYEGLMQLAQLLLGGEATVRRSDFPLLAVEITWLRAAELPKVTRLEDLLSGRVPADLPPGVVAAPQEPPKPPPASVAAAPRPRDEEPVPTLAAPPAKEEATATAAPATVEPGQVESFKSRLPTSLRPLMTRDPEIEDGVLVLWAEPQLKSRLEKKTNAKKVADAVAAVWGEIDYDVRAPSPDAPPPATDPEPSSQAPAPPRSTPTPEAPPDTPEAQQHPVVQIVRGIFPGPITSRTRRTDNP